MYLRSLDIKNYRSLEHVELEHLQNFNVLIGRNNSGKSSIFGALSLVNSSIYGRDIDWAAALTARDSSRVLEVRLMFDLRPEDRRGFIGIVAANRSEERRNVMFDSPLFRKVNFSFKSALGGQILHLRETSLMAEDSHWAVVQRIVGSATTSNPENNILLLSEVANRNDLPVDRGILSVDTTSTNNQTFNLYSSFLNNDLSRVDRAFVWLLRRLGNYLAHAFFFNPFRHSGSRLPVQETNQLSQDGSNLAQVLHTINSNDRALFQRIEDFLHSALPDLGMMQTPIFGNSTEVSFRAADGGYPVRLHDMGGGIEQLLMIATVLLTTGEQSTLFIEEPESHLHAGAQRFLIEKLSEGDRQVLLTTHSPIFVNSVRRKSLYQVKLIEHRTTITYLNEANSLGEMLQDIGSRNSDVLLSDVVLFVEGPGDQRVLEIWSEKLRMSLEAHNIKVVPMGGGEDAMRTARVRSEVLQDISNKAPVPHLFILDRDERTEAEINRLQEMLGDRVHLFVRRELENYLLAPRALLAAVRSKHSNNDKIIEQVNSFNAKQLRKMIETAANELYGHVLVKRIRARLGGLKGGLLSRESVVELAHKINERNFPRMVSEKTKTRVSQYLEGLEIEKLVLAEKERLDKEWKLIQDRLFLAPGEEIVAKVFRNFGAEYKKPNDTILIAREMKADEIAPEIKELMKKAIALSKQTQAS